MTLEEINSMTPEEKDSFMNVICHSFQAGQSLEDYTEAIRDYIYIWRHIWKKRKVYTFAGVTGQVELEKPTIAQYYSEKAPVDDAAVDVEYCCG